MKIYIEYDNNKLTSLCNELYQLFKKNNYDVTLLNNTMSLSEKINIIKNSNNSFLLSNRLNTTNNTIEIIYPLRDNNKLAVILNNNLSNVSKYYQLRSNSITNLDYYEILRDYNNQALMIKYGENIINNNLANIIFQSINDYLQEKNIYIVKSGDSLYKISQKFNTSVDELKKINNLTSNLLSINQKLIIPNNQVNEQNNTSTTNTYIVKSGDSLYKISKEFNTSVDELKKINNLSSNLLSIGQILIIPNNEIIYVVQKGDSLYSISKKYNTSVDEIKKLNNLSSNLLSIGQKLTIKK